LARIGLGLIRVLISACLGWKARLSQDAIVGVVLTRKRRESQSSKVIKLFFVGSKSMYVREGRLENQGQGCVAMDVTERKARENNRI
jgi:hypothetical protein